MEFRRPTRLRPRRCPVCGLEKESGLGERCPEDGEILVMPELLDQMLVGGRFRVVEPVGQGAFARVYAASDRARGSGSGGLVAVKLLKPSMRHHQEALARFDREGDLLRQLEGVPGVVDLVHRGRTDAGDPFLALEYVDGQTLQEVLHNYGHLPPIVACRIALALLEAVGAIHRLGIVHRDLKPSNMIMLSAGDAIDLRLLDFGIAQSPDRNDNQLTMQHRTVGTPQYMSPELWNSSRVDRRSDLYAIGVILHYMLVGSQPYIGDTVQIANQHKTSAVPRIAIKGDILPVMSDVVTKAMSKLPEQRFASAEEMYDALAGGLGLASLGEVRAARGSDTLIEQLTAGDGSPISLPSGSSSTRVAAETIKPARPSPRRLLRVALTAVFAGALAGSLALGWGSHGAEAGPQGPFEGTSASVEFSDERIAAPAPVTRWTSRWTPGVARAELTTRDSERPPIVGDGSSDGDDLCKWIRVQAGCELEDPITGRCLNSRWRRKKVCPR